MEFLGLIGHSCGEVVCFGEVFGKIKEFETVLVPVLDEFEVAQAEGSFGWAADGVVEDEERVVASDFALALVVKDGEHAAAVYVFRKRFLVVSEFSECGKDVEACDRYAGDRVALDVWTNYGEWYPEAAFVHGGFAVAKGVVTDKRGFWCFGDGVASAVVGEEKDIGVIGYTESLDLVEDLACLLYTSPSPRD